MADIEAVFELVAAAGSAGARVSVIVAGLWPPPPGAVGARAGAPADGALRVLGALASLEDSRRIYTRAGRWYATGAEPSLAELLRREGRSLGDAE
ncbi:MAG: hypothetical protein IPG45_06015 [Deltaproteobacteria bacterium]|nr:hypothetical protein [Deltaproteobacteria bacterium]